MKQPAPDEDSRPRWTRADVLRFGRELAVTVFVILLAVVVLIPGAGWATALAVAALFPSASARTLGWVEWGVRAGVITSFGFWFPEVRERYSAWLARRF